VESYPHSSYVTIRTGSLYFTPRGGRVTSGSEGYHEQVLLSFRLWPISIYVVEPSRVSGTLFRVSHFRKNSIGSRTNGLTKGKIIGDYFWAKQVILCCPVFAQPPKIWISGVFQRGKVTILEADLSSWSITQLKSHEIPSIYL
jgi:hypothetical protein